MKRFLRYSAFYLAFVPELLFNAGLGAAAFERNQIETMSMFKAVVINIVGLGFVALAAFIAYLYLS